MPVPADHQTTIKQVGVLDTLKMIVKAGWNYRNTIFYYLKRGEISRLDSFLYTKIWVPTGEGAGELGYYLIADLYRKFPQLAPYPRYIEVEVTTKCDKKCIICEHTHWNEPAKDLKFDQFKKLADQFRLKWINLTGEGDAFLNKDYFKMIEYCKGRNASVFLTDSFDLITPDISNKLVELGVDGIYFSIDGAKPETYESLKEGCDYNRTWFNVSCMIASKRKQKSPIPELCIRYALTTSNINETAEFVKIVNRFTREDWGDGSKIHFIGLLDYPEVHHLYLDEIPEEVVKRTVDAVPKGGVPVVFAHLDDSKNPDINTCLAWLEPYFALVPEHMVLPCCAVLMSNERDKLQKYSFGNYLNEPFRDIWNSKYYKWFRSQVNKPNAKVPALCADCRAYDTSKREWRYGIDYRTREDF